MAFQCAVLLGAGILGSYVISHCVGDNLLTYQINCLKGSMKLTKASSCKHARVLEARISRLQEVLTSLASWSDGLNLASRERELITFCAGFGESGEPTGWQVEISTENSSGGTNFSIQSIGHQNCHDAFAEELYEKLFGEEEEDSLENQEIVALVDISINGALADSAVIEGILASVQVRALLTCVNSSIFIRIQSPCVFYSCF